MVACQQLIAEERNACDGMHVLRMQKADQLRQVADGMMLRVRRQMMIECHVKRAIAILNVEDNGVTAQVMPSADKADAIVASRHGSGEVNGLYFKISGHDGRVLDDWLGFVSRNHQLLTGLQGNA